MVTREDVTNAYRLILGREPESDAVIEGHRKGHRTLATLREAFLTCPEFKNNYPYAPEEYPLDCAPALDVDINVGPDTLAKLLAHTEAAWQSIGRTEPHWSVNTQPHYHADQIADTETLFYSEGESWIRRIDAWLERNRVDGRKLSSCLEYGCGVGRLTGWLARRFRSVVGCDISSPHLDLARTRLEKERIGNAELRKISSVRDISTLGCFDMVYSVIVLQHNPPPIMAEILRGLMNSLNPSGVLFFQVPTYAIGYSFDAISYLKTDISERHIEMHVLPQREIFRIVSEGGGRVLEIQPDGYLGGGKTWMSSSILVQKN